MKKEEIKKINNQLKSAEDFTAIKTLLEIIGRMDGKVYGVLNRRVVVLKENHGHIDYHDAYVWAE